MSLSKESAEAVGLQALSHLLGDSTGLERFMALTGLSAGDIRRMATDGAFLAGVLDYYLGNEADLLAMCAATQLGPEQPRQARQVLAGDMGSM